MTVETRAASTSVLLADDHQLMRQGLRSMLDEQENLRVVGEADEGRTAVRLAKELRPDLVIMDVTMPDLNGIDATRQIRSENPRVKVIALSMHAERQFVMEMLGAGASGYLPKDCPFDELLAAISAVIRGDTFLSPKVTGLLVKEVVGGVPEAGAFCGTLSPREREVLQLVAEGKSSKEIALMLHLSSKTVEGHRRQIMDKLKLYSVAELTRYAIREGVTSLG
jgi:DNA-binding NarL/FixJ family response regulator